MAVLIIDVSASVASAGGRGAAFIHRDNSGRRVVPYQHPYTER